MRQSRRLSPMKYTDECCLLITKDIQLLEKVQRISTKLVEGFHKLSYQDFLKSLGLKTLDERRNRGDLFEAYINYFIICKKTLDISNSSSWLKWIQLDMIWKATLWSCFKGEPWTPESSTSQSMSLVQGILCLNML